MRGWRLNQYDFITAFLNATLSPKFTIYMEQPTGFALRNALL